MQSINLNFNQSFSSPDFLEFKISGSKSISQRILIINYLQKINSEINNLSNSEDTAVLLNALNSKERIVNLKQSGTAIRFLLTVFAYEQKNTVLEGDAYLLKRPINALIDALNNMGANIEKKNNCIIIKKSHLIGRVLHLHALKTSQFVSSLLLVSPYIKNGVHLIFDKNICSKPYINMTTSIMQSCGAKLKINKNEINIYQSEYTNTLEFVESDWTSASYLFLAFLFSNVRKIKIQFLNNNSIQGDSIITEFFSILGVVSKFDLHGVFLEKEETNCKPIKIEWNFIDHPDLFPTIIVACVGLGIELVANGVSTLIYKESNRVLSMKNELIKFNIKLIIKNKDSVHLLSGSSKKNDQKIFIDSHNDHRIALSLAPLSLLGYNLQIDNRIVINKSYPNFFNDLTKFGVLIT